jgi:hypothetical protein
MSGHAHEISVHDGDLVRGYGSVVAIPGHPVRFCSGHLAEIEGASFGFCPVGVELIGADLDQLYDRKTHGKEIRGQALITGVFQRGAITVRTQVAQPPANLLSRLLHQDVPGAARGGGGPGAPPPAMTTVFRYRREHPDAIVQIAELHPDPAANVVYILTAGDPDPVRTALADKYGDRLCVQRSMYSAAQLAAARALVGGLFRHSEDPLTRPSSGGGIGLGPTLQVDTEITVPMVDDQLAELLDRQPEGLIEIDAWLVRIQ